RADRLNLAAVSQVASRLPLNAKLRSTLRQLAPQGRVDRLQVDWQGAWPQATGFTAKGRVSQLALASQPADTAGALGVPGLQGASVDFDIHENGGKAQLLMLDGVMDFPGVFDQPRVPFGLLQGEVQWQYDAQRIQVQANHLRFANRDAQGELQFKWQNAPVPPGTSPASGTPGLLDLQGSLGRARVVAVPRYLPSAMNTEVRNYLAQALVAGEGSNVYFKVKGDLNQFPFAPEKGGAGGITNGAGGEFQISADIRNASYAYLPPALQPGDSPPWPMLTHLSTHMLLDRDRLEFKASKGLLGAEGHLPFDRTVVRISDLYNATTVTVYTNLHGPLAEALAVVNSTPVGGMMGHALARSRVQGQADYHIGLGIALAHPDQIVVQGTVLLGNADFQFSPEVPPISHLKGPVSFTQNGFSLAGVQGRALGGDVQLDGGMVFGSSANAANATDGLHIQGTVTAEGLRAAPQLGLVRSLARFASGSAAYSVNLSLRNGVPEWAVNSPLRGMELNLPEPFAKSADSNWPLRVATALVPGTQQEGVRLQDQWEVDVGQLLHLRYVRDIAGAAPKVLRGAIALGLQDDESAPLPDAGVFANLRFNDVDADSWQAVVKRLTEAEPDQSSSPERAPPVSSTASSTDSTASTDSSTDYLPGRVALQAHQLTLGGRSFNQVLLGGTHEGGVWHGNVYADELDGYVEYLQSSDSTPGRVYARLGHLRLGPSAQQDVENLFDQQPASVPALDIVVEEMHLHGKNLGRVEVQATHIGVLLHPDTAWHPASDTTQNTAPDTASDTASDTPPVTASVAAAETLREWRLDRLNIMTPEAVFSATGNWASIHPQLPQPPELPVSQPGLLERRRTRLNFRLDVVDSGALLSRFGMPGVIAKGRGKVQGQVSWLGSPFSPDYPSMGGGFNLDIESGQFLKAEPGIAKLLGVLSLQSLPRRLTLDFRDVFSEGFSFDFVRGDASIEQGIARTSTLQMKGINANVLMEGQADLNKETQSLSVVVVPEVNVSSATLLYSTVNPAVGLSVYLANLALRDPLATANTRAFQIDGTWVSPQVTQVERKP
ncbi:MAG: DUF3971 domain-containing protein, partial [Rhodoferax sp.]|nr:DUF3971 domain-containing protein [Rhodoferax sp.]